MTAEASLAGEHAAEERERPRGLPQSSRLPSAILGIPFDCVTIPEALEAIDGMIESRRPHQLVTANVDFLVQSLADVELRRILAEADLVLCDGTPLVWASKWLGHALPERVAGADLVPLLIQRAVKRGYRLFFLGGKEEVAVKAVQKLKAEHPGLQIAGHYSPPFAPLLKMNHQEIRRRIRAAKPDVLLVSFGCPKAEKWIAMNCRSLGVPVCIGVGATIDFLAGEVKRAPEWMRHCGMEWVYRFLQEPARLGPRYALDLRRFGVAFARQWLHNPRPHNNGNRSGGLKFAQNLEYMCITAPEHLDLKTLAEDLPILPLLTESCLIDLSNVKSLDCSAIGWLVRLQRNLHAVGRDLVLITPANEVGRALRSVSLQDLFVVAKSRAEGERWLKLAARLRTPLVAENEDHSCSVVNTEITMRNGAKVFRKLLIHLRFHEPGDTVTLKMDRVTYIDSTGARAFARVHAVAQKRGLGLRLVHVQPAVRNVLGFAGLDHLVAA
jgi:N-acetylglucosaminyldiphosphoundecaprenol N-acetyl-beta-D-mannosaminyltransferase